MSIGNDFFDPSGAERAVKLGLTHLPGFALPYETELLAEINHVVQAAPFRHMLTPGGQRMSAAMSNCGEAGWVTDRKGYRYDRLDPERATVAAVAGLLCTPRGACGGGGGIRWLPAGRLSHQSV